MKSKTFLGPRKSCEKCVGPPIQSKLLNKVNLEGEIQYRLLFTELFIRCFYLADASVVNNMFLSDFKEPGY